MKLKEYRVKSFYNPEQLAEMCNSHNPWKNNPCPMKPMFTCPFINEDGPNVVKSKLCKNVTTDDWIALKRTYNYNGE